MNNRERKANYYQVLGIDINASRTDVIRAYKTRAREMHPDKNAHPSANAEFQLLNEAYQVLSDTTKRFNYNKYEYQTSYSYTPAPRQKPSPQNLASAQNASVSPARPLFNDHRFSIALATLGIITAIVLGMTTLTAVALFSLGAYTHLKQQQEARKQAQAAEAARQAQAAETARQAQAAETARQARAAEAARQARAAEAARQAQAAANRARASAANDPQLKLDLKAEFERRYSTLNTMTRDDILDLFRDICSKSSATKAKYHFINESQHPQFDKFRMFFMAKRPDENMFWRTKIYETIVTRLQNAYVKCSIPASPERKAEENFFLDHRPANTVFASAETNARAEFNRRWGQVSP